MSGRWEPGTVATILVDGNETTGLATGDGWMYADSAGADHLMFEQVPVVRPLVVLDPDDAEQVTRLGYEVADRLTEFWSEDILDVADRKIMGEVVQAVLKAQIRPPKPPEPTGLGAVVRDRAGRTFVRHEVRGGVHKWIEQCAPEEVDPRQAWARIDAVEVLSEGVKPRLCSARWSDTDTGPLACVLQPEHPGPHYDKGRKWGRGA